MPDTNNNDILGSTADVNAGSAVENVQAEEIKRLESEKQQTQVAAPQAIPNPPLITAEDVLSLMPPAAPLTAADMMQEAAQEAQARTNAAQARAAAFEAEAAAPVSPVPMPSPPPSRRSSFDAAAANARAANASQGFPVAQDASKITFSAPKDAPDAFDWFAYDEALQAQRIQVAGETPPAGGWDAADDPRIAPSPSYARTGMEPDLWEDRGKGRIDAAMGSATPELRSQLDSIRAAQTARRASIASVVADSPSYSPSAADEEAPKRTYASYEEAQQAKADILADARNAYAQSGRVSEIGKAGFNAEVKAVEISQGLQEPKGRGLSGALANMREDFADPSGYGKLNYGYAVQKLGEEGGQYYEKTNSGQYVTPEQQETAAAGLLPGIGAVAGTAIGSMIAPGVGSWVGGMVKKTDGFTRPCRFMVSQTPVSSRVAHSARRRRATHNLDNWPAEAI